MWTDTDNLARVRDPTVQLLLGHTGSLADGVRLRVGVCDGDDLVEAVQGCL